MIFPGCRCQYDIPVSGERYENPVDPGAGYRHPSKQSPSVLDVLSIYRVLLEPCSIDR
jgi:hypothetical protein